MSTTENNKAINNNVDVKDLLKDAYETLTYLNESLYYSVLATKHLRVAESGYIENNESNSTSQKERDIVNTRNLIDSMLVSVVNTIKILIQQFKSYQSDEFSNIITSLEKLFVANRKMISTLKEESSEELFSCYDAVNIYMTCATSTIDQISNLIDEHFEQEKSSITEESRG